MRTVFTFILFCSLAVSGTEFHLYGKFDSRDPNLEYRYESLQIGVRGNPTPYFAVRAYPAGQKSKLLKFVPGKAGEGFTFESNAAREILWLPGAWGKVFAAPDLFCAFRIFSPPECGGRFQLGVWVKNRNKGADFSFQVEPGAWRTVKIPLFGTGFLNDGDWFSDMSLSNCGTRKRAWKMDGFAVWRGDSPLPAAPAGSIVTAEEDGNRLSWNASSSVLPVSHYRVHRGSVENFFPDDGNLIAETAFTEYIDRNPMRRDDFYKVVTEDVAGKRSVSAICSRK